MPKKRGKESPNWEKFQRLHGGKAYFDRKRQDNREYTNWTGSKDRDKYVNAEIVKRTNEARKELLRYEKLGRAIEKKLDGRGRFKDENVEKAAEVLEGMKWLAYKLGDYGTGSAKYDKHVQIPEETKEYIAERIKDAANRIIYASADSSNINEAPHKLKGEYSELMEYANKSSDPNFKYDKRGWRILGGNAEGTKRIIGRRRVFSLENRAIVAAILSLIGAIFFLSSNLTDRKSVV
jgi:hypothetical protein